MTSQVLGENDKPAGLTWEETLAIVAVLVLAGVFIWYQAFPRTAQIPLTVEAETPQAVVVAAAPAPVIMAEKPAPTLAVEQADAVPKAKPIAHTTMEIVEEPAVAEPVAIVEELPVVETIVDVEPAPAVQMVKEETMPEPVVAITPEVAPVVEIPVVEEPTFVAPPAATTAFEMVRNIQTNHIDFSGTVTPNTMIQLIIEGEVSEVINADGNGVWKYAKKLEPGFYTFEIQTLNKDKSIASSSQPATYQILPINQSSGDQ